MKREAEEEEEEAEHLAASVNDFHPRKFAPHSEEEINYFASSINIMVSLAMESTLSCRCRCCCRINLNCLGPLKKINFQRPQKYSLTICVSSLLPNRRQFTATDKARSPYIGRLDKRLMETAKQIIAFEPPSLLPPNLRLIRPQKISDAFRTNGRCFAVSECNEMNREKK